MLEIPCCPKCNNTGLIKYSQAHFLNKLESEETLPAAILLEARTTYCHCIVGRRVQWIDEKIKENLIRFQF